ncbi:PREDICTED: transmembrane protein 97-like [Populus euphratica]|uniref:Transmembrane protein 97-like n=1 Tax=Populus euphratica TaxID=75702 RepID=A0AAJ6VI11_POPEU|nr:PREDICTED: transmembrane protein 97-like [Populus euphratica]
MGVSVFLKIIDFILFFFFLVIAVAAPLIDAQTCLPLTFFPDFLINLKQWYGHHYGDYLIIEKPHFFVGLVWLELLFQWPLSLLNLYAFLASKSWFNTTCLIYGASVLTSMVAILAELLGSGKASDDLLMMYSPFLGLGVLCILRGLVQNSSKTSGSRPKSSRIPALARKKKA